MAVLKSPHSHGVFLQSALADLDEFIAYISDVNGVKRAREAVVKKLCGILKLACKGSKEKTSSLMFIAHQIIADLEEFVSNNDDRGASPFTGDFIWPGYGGKEGFTAIDHETILGRICSDPGFKDWHDTYSPLYFGEMCLSLRKYMEHDLNRLMLAMLGVEKVAGRIKVQLTGRFITNSDFEHLMCKVFMGCMRSRGTRNGGVPKPCRNYCWPSKQGDTVGSTTFEDIVCITIISAYENSISDNATGQLPDLEHPFCDIQK